MQRAADGPAAFLIVCPQSDPEAAEHPEAERRLRAALSTLRAEGIEAHGQVAHPDPYTAAMQVVDDEQVDEIIVSTFPASAPAGCGATSSSASGRTPASRSSTSSPSVPSEVAS